MRLERLVRALFWGTLLVLVGLNVALLNIIVFDCVLAGLLGSYYNTNGIPSMPPPPMALFIGASIMLLFAVPSTVVVFFILKRFINSIKELTRQVPNLRPTPSN
jgi:uncharacterized membrane protein YjjP (DUF1212 family)